MPCSVLAPTQYYGSDALSTTYQQPDCENTEFGLYLDCPSNSLEDEAKPHSGDDGPRGT
ncbi:hypothetical protein N657DRAFT_642719 [Parathielavia appendiculata]|uniref:Uncharacterized protein n=1 Tax=Parathielavia appendiculata TaxID=2587402 RepID=A0AAN6Z520_9PEZI|nr:hypothetical protein N657DRAFT_642719 [Parathielavia appendiculata]